MITCPTPSREYIINFHDEYGSEENDDEQNSKLLVEQQESEYENEDELEADEECNIILLGDCKVGKTKITRQFGGEEYLPYYLKTLGMDFENVSLTVLDLLVECKIVDISGQQRFHTKDIFNTYLSTANAIIFVYDITNITSYYNIQRKWLPMIENKITPECALIMVGTQCDNTNQRQVKYKQAKVTNCSFFWSVYSVFVLFICILAQTCDNCYFVTAMVRSEGNVIYGSLC